MDGYGWWVQCLPFLYNFWDVWDQPPVALSASAHRDQDLISRMKIGMKPSEVWGIPGLDSQGQGVFLNVFEG
jgi:hypothetical protein